MKVTALIPEPVATGHTVQITREEACVLRMSLLNYLDEYRGVHATFLRTFIAALTNEGPR